MIRIVFDKETKAMLIELKNANGYLDCENIILKNLKKHDNNRVSIIAIESYLRKLLKYIEDKAVINKDNTECENYTYAASLLRSIIETPYWDRWIKK
jgi:hypothetical protein